MTSPWATRFSLHALDTRESGVVDVSLKGEPSLCAFASTETVSFLVIAPKAVVAKLPQRSLRHPRRTCSRKCGVLVTDHLHGHAAYHRALSPGSAPGPITRPIFSIVEAAKRLTRGDFNAHIDQHTGDERDDVIRSINEMGPKLRELMPPEPGHGGRPRRCRGCCCRRAEPELSGFDISGGILYCDKTGGDYYDFLHICKRDPACLAVILGDVSGHGVPSALVMAAARGQLHTLADIEMAPHDRTGRHQ